QAQDAKEAARRYRDLATGDDTIAARALEDLAYVELFHLSDPRSALTHGEEYERRFPRGAQAADALWLRMEAAQKLDDHATARALAERYLTLYPAGQKATRARIVRGVR